MDPQYEFEAHSSYVLGVLFTPDNGNLVSASMDNTVKVWQVPGWELLREFKGHSNSVNGIAISPDGKTLATGSSDQTVKLWSLEGGDLLLEDVDVGEIHAVVGDVVVVEADLPEALRRTLIE